MYKVNHSINNQECIIQSWGALYDEVPKTLRELTFQKILQLVVYESNGICISSAFSPVIGIFTFQPIVLGKCKSAVFMNDCRYALSDLYLLLLSQFSIQQQVVPQTGRYRVKSPFSATSLVLYLEVLSLHPLQLLLILSTILLYSS